jgi:exodeoxyribonuclease VII small subunit
MKKKNEITYSKAIAELEAIVNQIEKEDVDVDILTERVKRADYLSKFCRNKLRSAEEEIMATLREIESSTEGHEE